MLTIQQILKDHFELSFRIEDVFASICSYYYMIRGDYHSLVNDFEFVYFDTAMNCVHNNVFSNNCPGRGFFIEHQDRILFWSDFPNIPHSFSKQIGGLHKLNLGETIERKLFSDNAIKLLGLEGT